MKIDYSILNVQQDKELQELHKTIENLQRRGFGRAEGNLVRYALSFLESNQAGLTSGTSDSENDENMSHSNMTLKFKERKSRWVSFNFMKMSMEIY